MTNRTAQAEIAETAATHGWTHSGGQWPTLSRGDVVVKLWFTRSGAVHGATRQRPGQTSDRPARDRRNAVLSWLTAEPADAAVREAMSASAELDRAHRDAAEPAMDVPHPTTPQGMSSSYIGSADPYADGDESTSDPVAEIQLRDLEQREAALADQADEDAAIVEGLVAVIAKLEARVGHLQRVAERGDRDADRIVELERRAATQTENYRAVRARVTELEDQRSPARGAFHDLVHALRPEGMSAETSEAVARLARALGVAIPGPFVVEPERLETGVTLAARPTLVLVDEVVPEVVGAPEPTTVREALKLDGHARRVGLLLPGESATVAEHAADPEDSGHPRVRVYGVLRRPAGGDREVLTIADGRGWSQAVPLHLVLPYLAAVRAAGFPAPARRLAILDAVQAGHPAVGGSAG